MNINFEHCFNTRRDRVRFCIIYPSGCIKDNVSYAKKLGYLPLFIKNKESAPGSFFIVCCMMRTNFNDNRENFNAKIAPYLSLSFLKVFQCLYQKRTFHAKKPVLSELHIQVLFWHHDSKISALIIPIIALIMITS